MADRVGQQLGNYRLIRPLEQGGLATVYLGEDVRFDTQVAIKVLRVISQLSDELERFRTQTRTLARLRHPNIVKVLDFGTEGDIAFLVMDYAPNGTLRQRHPRGEKLPLVTIISYVKQMASALQYIHDAGLIHRNVKPQNMLLGRNNEILLGGFAAATTAQSAHNEDIVGTPPYMAPEQIEGKPLPASDQYSLGIIVYEWLTGDRPFTGSPVEIIERQIKESPPPLREKVPTIPQEIEQVVLIALEKDPRRRFASVRAFANALEQAASVDRRSELPSEPPLSESLEEDFSSPMESTNVTKGAAASGYLGEDEDEDYAARSAPSPAAPSSSPLPPSPSSPLPPAQPYSPPPYEIYPSGPAAPSSSPPPQPSYSPPQQPGYTPYPAQQGSPAYGAPYYSPPPVPPYAAPAAAGSVRGIGGWGSPTRAESPPTPQPRNLPLEQLQFSAYYSNAVGVGMWNTLLVYAHIASALQAVRADAARFKNEMGPIPREVRAQASQLMTRGIPITIVPRCQGVTFNPGPVSFIWLEDSHQARFRFYADNRLTGSTGNGLITIYVGPLIIATIQLSFLFLTQEQALQLAERQGNVEARAQVYKQIFTSYSHDDKAVVLACRNVYRAAGLNTLIDIDTLRAGQHWNATLMRMIEACDVFQLFWSPRAAASQYVRQEWQYAVQHYKGEGFIRPVYWEQPLVPPPQELSMLHFEYIQLPKLEERQPFLQRLKNIFRRQR